MYSSQYPRPNDQYERDAIIAVSSKRPTAEEARSSRPTHDLGVGRNSFDQSVGKAEKLDFSAGSDANLADVPIAELRRLAEINQRLCEHSSLDAKTFRTVAGFVIAALIGVGATFAWHQADNAKEMTKGLGLSLNWLSSFSTTKEPVALNVADEQTSPTPGSQVAAQDAAISQPAPNASAPPTAATSTDLVQQLDAIARELAIVQRNLEQVTTKQEQFAAKQEQMAHDMATWRAEQDTKQKIPSSLSRAVPVPPRKKASMAASMQTAAQPAPAQLLPEQSSHEPRPAPIPRPPLSVGER